jgi:hypothetical protein
METIAVEIMMDGQGAHREGGKEDKGPRTTPRERPPTVLMRKKMPNNKTKANR